MPRKLLFIMLIGVLAAGSLSCGFSVDLGSTPPTTTSYVPTETLEPTSTPVSATPTQEPSPTEEIIPTSLPSPTPLPPPQIITVDNASSLTFKRSNENGYGSLQKFKVSPDGKYLLLSYSASLQLLSLIDLSLIWEVEPGKLYIDAAFSEDGSHVITATAGGTVQIRDTATGSILSTTKAQQEAVFDISLSDNGKILAVTDFKDETTIWDTESGKQIQDNNGQSNPGGLNSILVSPGGQLLILDGYGSKSEKQVQQWRTSDGTYKIGLLGLIPEMRSWKFSPDEKRIFGINYRSLTASASTTINAWNADTGALIKTYPSVGIITKYIISPDGTTILVANGQRELILLDVESGEKKGSFTGHTARIAGMDFSPDSQGVVSIDIDGKIIEWDAVNQTEVLSKDWGFVLPLSPVAFSANGRLTAVTSPDRKRLGVLETEEWKNILIVGPEQNNLNHLAISNSGNLIAGCDAEGRIIIWDVTNGAKLNMIQTKTRYPIFKIKFSQDENHISSLSSGQIFVWDIASGKKITEFAGSEDFGYSPTEKVIASDSTDYNLYFTDEVTGKKLGTVKSDFISAIEYSPDGQYVAIAGQKYHSQQLSVNNMIYVIDSQTKESLPIEMAGIHALVTDIAWNPSQDILASKDEQGNVQIWDLQNGNLITLFEEISMSPGDLAFNEDGSILFVGGRDGTIALVSTIGNSTTDSPTYSGAEEQSAPELSDLPYTHTSGAVTINLPKGWNPNEKSDLSFIASSPNGTAVIAFLATNTNSPLSNKGFETYINASEQNLEMEFSDYSQIDKTIDINNSAGSVTKTVNLNGIPYSFFTNYYRIGSVVYQINYFVMEDLMLDYIPLYQGVNVSLKINPEFIQKQIPYEELNNITDPSGKFSFSYPQGWILNESNLSQGLYSNFSAPDNNGIGHFEVLPLTTETQKNDDQMFILMQTYLEKTEPDLTIVRRDKTVTGGWQIKYAIPSKVLNGIITGIRIDNSLQTLNITYNTSLEEKYKPLIEKIITEFKNQ